MAKIQLLIILKLFFVTFEISLTFCDAIGVFGKVTKARNFVQVGRKVWLRIQKFSCVIIEKLGIFCGFIEQLS